MIQDARYNMLKQIALLPKTWVLKGPDMLRGANAITFIVTPYTDDQGQNYFQLAGKGHEDLINDDVVKGLFGPKLDEVLPDIVQDNQLYDRNGPVKDEFGNPVRRKDWDWYLIRKMTRSTALYGRYGKISNHPVAMVWEPPANWQPMLMTALEHLKISPESDTVITIGINQQFLARDFIEAQKKSEPIDAPLQNKERLEKLMQYHTATGERKIALAKELGLKPLSSTGLKRSDWRNKGRELGLNVFDYGETTLKFRDFYDRHRNG